MFTVRILSAGIAFLALGQTVSVAQQVDFPGDRTLTLEMMASLAVDRDGRQAVVIDDMIFDVQALRNLSGQPKWPNGVIVYDFASNVSATQKQIFVDACEFWAAVSKVTCKKRTTDTNYVEVTSSSENSSWVGMIGGKQQLLIYNWNYPYVVAHELGHAFGFVHEHQRSDRDARVIIHWENIRPDAITNFYKLPTINLTVYDYDSVLHYDRYAFTKNGGMTIEPQYLAPTMGQRDHLSLRDKNDFKLAYGEHPTNKTIPVWNMIDVAYAPSKEVLFNTPNVGYEIRSIDGPTTTYEHFLNKCESTLHEATIYWQAVEPGTMVKIGTVVDVKTRDVTTDLTYPNSPCP